MPSSAPEVGPVVAQALPAKRTPTEDRTDDSTEHMLMSEKADAGRWSPHLRMAAPSLEVTEVGY